MKPLHSTSKADFLRLFLEILFRKIVRSWASINSPATNVTLKRISGLQSKIKRNHNPELQDLRLWTRILSDCISTISFEVVCHLEHGFLGPQSKIETIRLILTHPHNRIFVQSIRGDLCIHTHTHTHTASWEFVFIHTHTTHTHTHTHI